jgi:hypothetical protein
MSFLTYESAASEVVVPVVVPDAKKTNILHYPLVDDFLLEFVLVKLVPKLSQEKNSMLNYSIYAAIILFFVISLYLFVMSQLKVILPEGLDFAVLSKFLQPKYSMYYGIALILSSILLTLINKNASLYGLIITGGVFVLVSVSKVQCKDSIRWPLFIAGLLLLSYSVLNLGFIVDTGGKNNIWYDFLGYSTIISIVAVLLDFYIFIPYKCVESVNYESV